MNSNNVVKFERRPRSRRTKPEPAQRQALSERLLCIAAGVIVATIGWGSLSAILYRGWAELRLALLPLLLPLPLIGLFGVNLIIQGSRGRSRHQGIFYSLLEHLARIGPKVWSLFIPFVAVSSLLLATLLNDAKGIEVAISVLLFWVVLMTNIAVHELGHAFAAKLSSVPLTRVIVGPAELIRTEGAWQLRLSREWLSLVGGFVELSPGPLPATRLLVFASGGPLATALLLLSIVLFSPLGITELWHASRSPQNAILSLGFTTAAMTLALNLIPFRNLALGMPSDGYQIIYALRTIASRRRGHGHAA